MSDERIKTQGSLVPPRIWLWLAPSIDGRETRIRKFSHAPFPEGVEYVPAPLLARESEMGRTRTYRTWEAMKCRCQNPNMKDFHHYGGRGITVCEDWQKFSKFLADMGERPDGMTLDRMDVNGNYEKDNCKWSTPKEQANNRRPYRKGMRRGPDIANEGRLFRPDIARRKAGGIPAAH